MRRHSSARSFSVRNAIATAFHIRSNSLGSISATLKPWPNLQAWDCGEPSAVSRMEPPQFGQVGVMGWLSSNFCDKATCSPSRRRSVHLLRLRRTDRAAVGKSRQDVGARQMHRPRKTGTSASGMLCRQWSGSNRRNSAKVPACAACGAAMGLIGSPDVHSGQEPERTRAPGRKDWIPCSTPTCRISSWSPHRLEA